MKDKAERVVALLKSRNEQIATMESCTGGALASMITNIAGSSEVLLFSAVTYSNEYKIKMGVPKEIIDQYTVYSIETARAMATAISAFAHSHYGVGITGKLKRSDPNNPTLNDDFVYFAIYDRTKDSMKDYWLQVTEMERVDNKNMVVEQVLIELEKILS